jgi:hypothetical protein
MRNLKGRQKYSHTCTDPIIAQIPFPKPDIHLRDYTVEQRRKKKKHHSVKTIETAE